MRGTGREGEGKKKYEEEEMGRKESRNKGTGAVRRGRGREDLRKHEKDERKISWNPEVLSLTNERKAKRRNTFSFTSSPHAHLQARNPWIPEEEEEGEKKKNMRSHTRGGAGEE